MSSLLYVSKIITRYSVTANSGARAWPIDNVAETYKCKDGYARIFCNQPDWKRLVEWETPELMDQLKASEPHEVRRSSAGLSSAHLDLNENLL
jgi:hypothetical protein